MVIQTFLNQASEIYDAKIELTFPNNSHLIATCRFNDLRKGVSHKTQIASIEEWLGQ